MLVCSHCAHQNPISAVRCEACFSMLPALTNCFNCGTALPTEAKFCGQCGATLRADLLVAHPVQVGVQATADASFTETPLAGARPEYPMLDRHPEVHAEVMVIPDLVTHYAKDALTTDYLDRGLERATPDLPSSGLSAKSTIPSMLLSVPESQPLPSVTLTPMPLAPMPATEESVGGTKTKLQERAFYLIHLPSNTTIEIPSSLPVLHIGKPNDRIPPNIDIAGFPHSEVVSRIHADLRVEGDAFFLEDVGSANGTYVNNLPLLPGNRHRLRIGDRIAFGKGNLVTFLFQLI